MQEFYRNMDYDNVVLCFVYDIRVYLDIMYSIYKCLY